MKPSHLLLLTLLFVGTLFLRGCDTKSTTTTTGLIAPFAEFELDGMTVISVGDFEYRIGYPSKILAFSPLLLAVNLFAFAWIAPLIAINRRRLASASGRLLIASLWTAFALFNSAIYLPFAWFWLVLYPTHHIAELVKRFVSIIGRAADEHTIVDIASRLYFILLVGSLALVFVVVRFLATRFRVSRVWHTHVGMRIRSVGTQLVPGRRQFSLKAIVIVMLLFSVLFGWIAIEVNKHRYMQQLTAAQHHSTSPEELTLLYKTGDTWIRQYVASNPSAPVELLRRIGQHTDPWIAQRIYVNPSAPAELLCDVVRQHKFNSYGGSALSHNPSTPAELLRQVFEALETNGDYYPQTLRGLSDHPNTPPDVLQVIADKEPDELLYIILPKEDLHRKYAETGDLNATILGATLRKSLRPELLQLLADRDDVRVRKFVRDGIVREEALSTGSPDEPVSAQRN